MPTACMPRTWWSLGSRTPCSDCERDVAFFEGGHGPMDSAVNCHAAAGRDAERSAPMVAFGPRRRFARGQLGSGVMHFACTFRTPLIHLHVPAKELPSVMRVPRQVHPVQSPMVPRDARSQAGLRLARRQEPRFTAGSNPPSHTGSVDVTGADQLVRRPNLAAGPRVSCHGRAGERVTSVPYPSCLC
jgi:hypothetical protein